QGVGALQVEIVDPHASDHHHRAWRELRELLERAAAPAPALAIFSRLAEAEGRVHDVQPEDVHFHELGSIDTIMDVCGAVVLLGEAHGKAATDVVLLETNLDDLNPELVPDAVERCFAAGALDVWTVPAQMKKGRPGLVLSALARPSQETAVAHAILEETSAL